jgi:methylated-DNA-[protein]-cysteine S-methyltransferase
MMNSCLLDSPLGQLQLISNGRALVQIAFPGSHIVTDDVGNDPVLERARMQLAEYFAGERRAFDLPLAAQGTSFQTAVWQALARIPFGELRSYRDIARAIGRPSAVRAVGAANGRNPLPIVVPCHRVIGSDGSLTGFAGGLDAKRVLLALENSLPVETGNLF